MNASTTTRADENAKGWFVPLSHYMQEVKNAFVTPIILSHKDATLLPAISLLESAANNSTNPTSSGSNYSMVSSARDVPCLALQVNKSIFGLMFPSKTSFLRWQDSTYEASSGVSIVLLIRDLYMSYCEYASSFPPLFVL